MVHRLDLLKQKRNRHDKPIERPQYYADGHMGLRLTKIVEPLQSTLALVSADVQVLEWFSIRLKTLLYYDYALNTLVPAPSRHG